MNSPTIPRWTAFYAAFLCIIPVVASVVALVAPATLFGPQLHLAGAAPAVGLYLCRNAGLLVLGLVTLRARTPALLSAFFVTRLVVDLGDLAVTVALGFSGYPAWMLVASWAVAFTGPQVAALRQLRSGS